MWAVRLVRSCRCHQQLEQVVGLLNAGCSCAMVCLFELWRRVASGGWHVADSLQPMDCGLWSVLCPASCVMCCVTTGLRLLAAGLQPKEHWQRPGCLTPFDACVALLPRAGVRLDVQVLRQMGFDNSSLLHTWPVASGLPLTAGSPGPVAHGPAPTAQGPYSTVYGLRSTVSCLCPGPVGTCI